MKVKQFMIDGVEGILPKSSILEAAHLMKKLNIGILPVIDENSIIIGILTDRDIVTRALAEELASSTTIDTIMTTSVQTIKETEEIGLALSLMAEKKIRRLPVIDDSNKLSGIISLADLALHQLTDERAGITLKEVSKPSNDPNNDLEVDDFPL